MEFPKTVYVSAEPYDNEDGEYLVIAEDATDYVDEGETKTIAVYELKEMVVVSWKKATSIQAVAS